MIFTDFLAVISFVMQCVFGLYYFFQDRASPLHRNFLYMCLTLAVISISNSSLRFGGIPDDDVFWNSLMYSGIAAHAPFTLLFFLRFTGYYKNIRHPVLFRLGLWLIPVFLIVMEVFLHVIQQDFPYGFWYVFIHIYFYLCAGSSIIIVAVWTRKTTFRRERKQGKLLIAGSAIAMFLAVTASYIMVQLSLPTITPVFYFMWGCVIFITVQKYRFMGITPELFSKDILEKIADYVIVFDSAGKIIIINSSVSQKISLSKGDFIQSITGPLPEFMEQLKTLGTVRSDEEIEKLILLPGSKGMFPIRGRFTVLRDEFSDVLGVLFTGQKYRDLTYIQQRFGLTHREMETAAHIVNGLSNRDIAEKMKITDNTVKTHITNLYQKLCITGKVELINYLRDFDPEQVN